MRIRTRGRGPIGTPPRRIRSGIRHFLDARPNQIARFFLISGKMPPVSSLHHGSADKPQILLGVPSHCNLISWSPHGRFLNLGGFGNLAGGINYWDINKKKTTPHTCSFAMGKNSGLRGNNASCLMGYLCSPMYHTFAISTMSPRMNADNGVRIYK